MRTDRPATVSALSRTSWLAILGTVGVVLLGQFLGGQEPHPSTICYQMNTITFDTVAQQQVNPIYCMLSPNRQRYSWEMANPEE
jgi:hypothetical protein